MERTNHPSAGQNRRFKSIAGVERACCNVRHASGRKGFGRVIAGDPDLLPLTQMYPRHTSRSGSNSTSVVASINPCASCMYSVSPRYSKIYMFGFVRAMILNAAGNL